MVLPENIESENELTNKVTVLSTSSRSTIPLYVPTERTHNTIDERMESELNIKSYQIKLKNIKIEFNNWKQLVADKRKEYDELTALCNDKYTTSLSNPGKVDEIVKVGRKEKLSKKEAYLIAEYDVDKYHLKDKKIRNSIQISQGGNTIKNLEH